MRKRKLTEEMLADEMTSHKRWDDFIAFHHQNPEVFEWLLREARASVKRGYRLSIAYLWERLRAEGPVEIASMADDFVLDNEFTPLYARALIIRGSFTGAVSRNTQCGPPALNAISESTHGR